MALISVKPVVVLDREAPLVVEALDIVWVVGVECLSDPSCRHEDGLDECRILRDGVIKADVQGSVEAVKQSLEKLSNEEVIVKTIHGGVGAINESDVTLASASNAIIIGFNVRADAQAKATADREGVDLRLYKVIYDAINDVEAAMKGMLDPIFEEKVIGHAEVRQTYKASGVGTILVVSASFDSANSFLAFSIASFNVVLSSSEILSPASFIAFSVAKII